MIIPLDYTTLCLTTTIHHQSDHTTHYTTLWTTTIHHQSDHTTQLHYTLLNNHHTSAEWSYHSTTLHSAQQPPYISRVIIPLNYTTLCSTTTIHQQSDHTTRLHYTLLNNHHTSSGWSYHSTTLHSAQQPPYISRVIIPLIHYTLLNNHHTSAEWSYHSTTLHSAQQPPYISRVIIPLNYTTLCLTTTIHHQSDHTTQLHYTLLNNHHTSGWSYHSTTLHS